MKKHIPPRIRSLVLERLKEIKSEGLRIWEIEETLMEEFPELKEVEKE